MNITTSTIKESPLPLALQIDATIPEFTERYSASDFESRLRDTAHLILVASVDDQPAGYLIAYERDHDGSFYCWMTGVNPAFRRRGILKKLMEHLYDWAKSHHYTKITIKTRNNRREMLSFLIQSGFNFTAVHPQPSIEENRILLEKSLP